MINLLIVDDHELFRDGLKSIIEGTSGINIVAEAASGGDALQKMRCCEWNVALLDISLPDISGLEVLKRMTEFDPSYRILVLSMYPEDEYAIRAIRSGASGYLTKDSPTDKLIAVIRRLANGGKYLDPALAEKLLFSPDLGSEVLPHLTLSDRELHVFKLITKGVSLTEIGNKLSLSIKTVSSYRSRILNKMHMKNNAQLIRYAIQHNLVA